MNTKYSFKNTTLLEWVFFLSVLMLLVFGLLVFYSLSVSENGVSGFWQQILQVLFGIVIFVWVGSVDYRVFRNVGWWFYLILIILLLLVLLVGDVEFGAKRWIDIGIIKFQPVEIGKFLYLVFMSDFFAKRGDKVGWVEVGYSLLLTALPVALIMEQPDLGSAMVFLAVWGVMVFLSSFSKLYFWLLLGLGLAVMPFSWFFLHDYQRNRILTFLDPTRDPYGMGYNILQSQIAIGSGGWFGLGLGKGLQSQLQFLPVAYSDFAFAVLGEEYGFAGVVLVILCYTYVVGYIWRLAFLTVDQFGYYLANGIGAILVFQVFVNIGMNIGVMPVTGIPLPLISSGGTSMWVTMILLGLIMSIKSKGVKI